MVISAELFKNTVITAICQYICQFAEIFIVNTEHLEIHPWTQVLNELKITIILTTTAYRLHTTHYTLHTSHYTLHTTHYKLYATH